ncbi:MAG: peptide chain release factor N(5)-glutamine methyltransferase [Bacteroidota bacterium]
MTKDELIVFIKSELVAIKGGAEASAIARRYVEDMLYLSRKTNSELLTVSKRFDRDLSRLIAGEPVQYVTGLEFFMDRYFQVDPSVLIPRPETEEMVRLAIADTISAPTTILDLCTGSGCIATSLALEYPNATVYGFDVSESALLTAKKNAVELGATVTFRYVDLLNSVLSDFPGELDLILSNPPYIPMIDFEKIDKEVRDFEPEIALFVVGNDPLLFYRKIAELASKNLTSVGRCYVEINRSFGQQVFDIFKDFGFKDVHMLKDISGNERIIRSSGLS